MKAAKFGALWFAARRPQSRGRTFVAVISGPHCLEIDFPTWRVFMTVPGLLSTAVI